ncbi:MAG: PEP-CTERM sorting domain-containing protein [Kiritimatiellae bacterium]|nr:PEP-CTERM sorting domain-containing protein [Kiritimatiellia bacterium]
MKKIVIIAAVALVAMSMQAAQINWGLTGMIKFNNNLVGSGATLTLVCLDGVTDWETYAKDVAAGKATSGIAATKTSETTSMAIPTMKSYAYTWSDEGTDIANAEIKKGTDFAFVVTVQDAGKSYYWASDAFTVSDTSSNWNGTKNTYTMSVTVSNAMGSDGSKWTAVPEPASAMLALAGVAMLIRRRK